jgi:hypothetical protein
MASNANRACRAPFLTVAVVLVLSFFVRIRLAGTPVERDEGEPGYASNDAGGKRILGTGVQHETLYFHNFKHGGSQWVSESGTLLITRKLLKTRIA